MNFDRSPGRKLHEEVPLTAMRSQYLNVDYSVAGFSRSDTISEKAYPGSAAIVPDPRGSTVLNSGFRSCCPAGNDQPPLVAQA